MFLKVDYCQKSNPLSICKSWKKVFYFLNGNLFLILSNVLLFAMPALKIFYYYIYYFPSSFKLNVSDLVPRWLFPWLSLTLHINMYLYYMTSKGVMFNICVDFTNVSCMARYICDFLSQIIVKYFFDNWPTFWFAFSSRQSFKFIKLNIFINLLFSQQIFIFQLNSWLKWLSCLFQNIF